MGEGVVVSESVVGLGGLFGDPPREFGLCPNWWWEGGVVSEEKLSWMLSEMARVGVGATFFYMRYSGDEPFAVVPAFGSDKSYELSEFSLSEHRRLGLGAYFSEWTGAHPVAERVGGPEGGLGGLGGWRLAVGGWWGFVGWGGGSGGGGGAGGGLRCCVRRRFGWRYRQILWMGSDGQAASFDPWVLLSTRFPSLNWACQVFCVRLWFMLSGRGVRGR